MNILIVTEFFPSNENCNVKGGVEARAFYIAKNLANRHNVYVITTHEKGLTTNDFFSNIHVLRVGKEREYSQLGNLSARISFVRNAIKQGKRLIKEKNIDVVDGYNFVSYPIAYKIAKSCNILCVYTYHDVWLNHWIKNIGLSGIIGEIVERYVLSKKINGYIAVSNYTKENLIKAGIDENKITVIYNGVDLEKYNFDVSVKEENTVCFVGRLVRYKRVDLLINAVSILKKEFENILLKIIGVGPEEENLKKLVKEKDLEKNVKFFGFVEDHNDVLLEIAKSKIFSLPSDVEGFGIVTVEAMACNTPYVCSNIKPIKEVTNNGYGGFLFEQGNYVDLADKIRLLLKDNDLYEKKINEEKEQVKNYDWDKLAYDTEVFYNEIINKERK